MYSLDTSHMTKMTYFENSSWRTAAILNMVIYRVVFVGKVSEGDEMEWHQHKVGHLVSYLEIQ